MFVEELLLRTDSRRENIRLVIVLLKVSGSFLAVSGQLEESGLLVDEGVPEAKGDRNHQLTGQSIKNLHTR